MSLGEKYKSFINHQHSLFRWPASKLFNGALWILLVSIVLFLVFGLFGIVLKFKMNEDAADLMAPVDTVYYQRYLKFKDMFATDSSKIYQPQWIMRGLGYYLSVVIYSEDDKGRMFEENASPGLDAMNKFQEMVESYRSKDNKIFTEICAKHEEIPEDHCYRMNMSYIKAPDSIKGSLSLYRMLNVARGFRPFFTLDFPTQSCSLGTKTYAVSTAEILGSSLEENGLQPVECERKAKSGKKYTGFCMEVGDNSERVQALRYAWHLRYETDQDKELAHSWLLEIQEKCKDFEDEINKNVTEGEAKWRFMCYNSLTITDGAKKAIQGDIKWIVLALVLSLFLPVLLVVKPCASDNFSMMVLIAVGLFFVNLIATIGLGSLLGFEFAYTFIVALLFLVWIFLRLVVHIVESLKDYLMISQKSKAETADEVFTWVFAHWTLIAFSNLIVISFTSFLVCSAMYKLIWYTSGFFGVFFLVMCFSFSLMFFSAIAWVIKSRQDDGKPCCMGKDKSEGANTQLDNPLMEKIKSAYKKHVINSSTLVRLIILGLFGALFIGCLLYSVNILMADESNETYYGYDRSDIVMPDDNTIYMLKVLRKYYPDNGPLVQVIFNNKSVYHYNGNETLLEEHDDGLFHVKLLQNVFFDKFWSQVENVWSKWLLSFYNSYITKVSSNGEETLVEEKGFRAMFSHPLFSSFPLMAVFNDMARVHVEELETPPYLGEQPGDPYTRMYIRQKYLSHTAQEVHFLKQLEMVQQKMKEDNNEQLRTFFPADSFELFSNLFEVYESSRDVVSRTVLIPPALVGCFIFTLLCACVSMPHPVAHLVIFLNAFMLFFEFFAIQTLIGTTINNFSMAYYFLMFIFAVDYTLYPVHLNLKYLLSSKSLSVPSPSPVPSVVVMVIAILSYLIMLVVPLYSLVGVSIRNCIFVFGIIGPLHELFFIPAIMKLVLSEEDQDGASLNNTPSAPDKKADVVMFDVDKGAIALDDGKKREGFA